MTWALFVNSSTVVRFQPEWNYADKSRKIETEHRTKSGKQYRYIWGSFKEFTFDVGFVSSSDACKVNSWWGANTELLFMNESGDTQVYSVVLQNNDPPLNKRVKPYEEYFKGKIELGTY